MKKFTSALEEKLKHYGMTKEEWVKIESETQEFLKKKGTDLIVARRREEQVKLGLIGDLNGVGIDIDNIWELVSTKDPYPEAIPILIKHIKLPYKDEDNKDGIARALAVPEAKAYWDELLCEYRTAPSRVKSGLACALAVIAKKTKRYHETLELLRDESLGSSRIILLGVISSSRNPEISSLIDEFADHPILGYETRIILKRRNKRKKT